MSSPVRKRRRLGASNALNKPFKSPLHRDNVPRDATGSTTLSQSEVQTPLRQPKESIPASSSSTSICSSPTKLSVPSSSPLQSLSATSKRVSSPKQAALRPLDSQHRILSAQLASLRQQHDTAQHAVRLEASSRDTELERLIWIWRDAARAAADELFACAKDRVNGMGGVVAWRERERERSTRFSWVDNEAGRTLGEGSEGAEGGNELDDYDERVEENNDRENEYAQTNDFEGAVIGREHEAFTMDMMLRSLGVELKTIGYDTESQCWTSNPA